MRHYLVFFILLLHNVIFSQTRIVQGVVSDTLGNFLQNASIIALPSTKESSLEFDMANEKGEYKLQLDSKIPYTVSVSYIGFLDQSFALNPNDNIIKYNFKLKSSTEKLQDVVISYKVKPLIIKEDTITYNVKSFTTGNERKLKDQLKKLPGVSVDKNGNVFIQGQRVSNTLVEGKSFFGGGSKLAVENIPADAVEKVEIISHFNDIAFLKNVSGSNKIALNIKLKKDKKNFVFGDLNAASGPLDFYKSHTTLFYYSPKTNLGYIGNLNNIASSALNFSDILRLQGGTSEFLSSSKSNSLLNLNIDNTDIFKNKTKFSGLDFSHELTKKIELTGYFMWSDTNNLKKQDTNVQFNQNQNLTFQNSENDIVSNNKYFVSNFKIKYNKSNNEVLKYNSNLAIVNNDNIFNLFTNTNSSNNNFENFENSKNVNFSNFLEWNKLFSTKHTTTIVASQNCSNSNQNNNWKTNNLFLLNLLPLQTDSFYQVNQKTKVISNNFEFLYKNYWIINNFNHVYALLGNNYKSVNYKKNEDQILSTGNLNNFELANFGNNLNYTGNKFYVGIEYKFIFGKWSNKLSLIQNFNLQKINNFAFSNNLNNNLLTPKFESEYKFSNAHTAQLNYEFTNQFPEYSQFANRYNIQNFNAIYKGNEQLKNEQFHNTTIYYKKNDVFHSLMFSGLLNFIYKTKTIKEAIIINNTSQIITPILQKNPEKNISFNGNITKNIGQFILGLNTNLSFNSYTQILNSISQNVNQESKNYGVSLKTNNTKWPFVTLKYNKIIDKFSGLTNFKINSDVFSVDFEYEINDNLIFLSDGNYQINKNNLGENNFSQSANASLQYKPTNSAWIFEILANNYLDFDKQSSNSFTDFSITRQTTFVLPRIIMLSVNYKL